MVKENSFEKCPDCSGRTKYSDSFPEYAGRYRSAGDNYRVGLQGFEDNSMFPLRLGVSILNFLFRYS